MNQSKRRLFKLAATSICLLGCGLSHSTPKTELGPTGNAFVEKHFSDYVASRANGNPGCDSGGIGRRILITGFGPFQTVRKNISGAVADSLSRSDFWPKNSYPNTISFPPNFPDEDIGSTLPNGIRANQREITYNGTHITLCTMVLNVQWDLAAAAIIFEAQKFAPDTVLMTGRGGSSFGVSLEAAAVNVASALPGFDSYGAPLGENNTPTDTYVLPPGDGVLSEIRLHWNTKDVAKNADSTLTNLNSALAHAGENAFRLLPQTAPSKNNTYICNNVSFVVQHAFQGVPVSLAGGKITLTIKGHPENTSLGFLHFPTATKTSTPEIWAWDHLILTIALGMKS